MAWNPLTDTEVLPGKIWGSEQATKVKDSLDYLNSQIGSLGSVDIPNGSFELDSDGDGVPDSWTWTAYPGGGKALSSGAHGANCFAITHPGGAGNGGGWIRSDYVPCSEWLPEVLSLQHWATAAGMKNIIDVHFYSASKTWLSSSRLYNSTNNPTSPTQLILGFTPPAGSRFYKIALVGGYTDTNVAGTAYFDGVTRLARPTVSGITNSAASKSTASTTWFDVATITVTLPYALGLDILLSLPVSVVGGINVSNIPADGSARLAIGTTYSNEITSIDARHQDGVCVIKAPGTSPPGKTIAVRLQAKSSDVQASATASVAANSVMGVI